MDINTIKDYITKGLSTREIAKEQGVSKSKILKYLYDNNLHTKFSKPRFSTALDILLGEAFGKLTVEKKIGWNGRNVSYLCRCSCGNKNVIASGMALKNGYKRSCGCLIGKSSGKIGPQESREVLGKRFGRLIAKKVIENEKGLYLIECSCDCGGIARVRACDLKRGASKSCGCLHKEMASKANCNKSAPSKYKWYFISNEGHKVRCDSGWEVVYANYLMDAGIKFKYHPETFLLSNGKRYEPDFLLEDTGEYIEIKGREFKNTQKPKRDIFSQTHKLKILYWKDISDTIPNLPKFAGTLQNRIKAKHKDIEAAFAARAYFIKP